MRLVSYSRRMLAAAGSSYRSSLTMESSVSWHRLAKISSLGPQPWPAARLHLTRGSQNSTRPELVERLRTGHLWYQHQNSSCSRYRHIASASRGQAREPGYVCTQCGARFLQFFGKCNKCGERNTIVQKVAAPAEPSASWGGGLAGGQRGGWLGQQDGAPMLIGDINPTVSEHRLVLPGEAGEEVSVEAIAVTAGI